MLNINITLIYLAINFFVLLFILNIILFKPLLKLFKEREDTVKSSLDAAKEMGTKREEGIAGLNREFVDARNKAKEIFEALKAEGLQKHKEIISATETEAAAILGKAMADVRAEAEKARKALRADVDKFSDEIVTKLVRV
jgi:F-type H+-transporting ATPase subunit b